MVSGSSSRRRQRAIPGEHAAQCLSHVLQRRVCGQQLARNYGVMLHNVLQAADELVEVQRRSGAAAFATPRPHFAQDALEQRLVLHGRVGLQQLHQLGGDGIWNHHRAAVIENDERGHGPDALQHTVHLQAYDTQDTRSESGDQQRRQQRQRGGALTARFSRRLSEKPSRNIMIVSAMMKNMPQNVITNG